MKPETAVQIARALDSPALQFALPEPVEGPAFPRAFKIMATLLMIGTFVFGVRAVNAPEIINASLTVKLVILGVLAMVLAFYYFLMTSRTRISSTEITQTWLGDKHVAIAAVIKAKFIYIPYLGWLFAPRLVVRSQSGMMTMFYAADPKVLAAFAQLSLLLQKRS
jgi:hypothetical protein